MLTAGTLVPMFQAVQPVQEKVSQRERADFEKLLGEEEGQEKGQGERSRSTADGSPSISPHTLKLSNSQTLKLSHPRTLEPSNFSNHREAVEAGAAWKMPSLFPKVEKVAKKLCFNLVDGEGGTLTLRLIGEEGMRRRLSYGGGAIQPIPPSGAGGGDMI